MNRGYIKLWRKSLDNDLIRNPLAWQLMCWCLLNATHKRMTRLLGTSSITLEPGQLITGRKKLAQELHSTEQKIRTALDLLIANQFLTIKSTNKFSIISITNWHTYQDDQPTNNQQDNQQDGRGSGNQQITSKSTNKSPTNNQLETSCGNTFRENENARQPTNNQQETQKVTTEQEEQERREEEDSLRSSSRPSSVEPDVERKPKTPRASPTFAEDSEPYRLAAYMRDQLAGVLPTFKEPNLQVWAHDFDVALRNDERMTDARFVAQVIKWVAGDSFWRTNCQCPATLRKQFDKLTARMAEEAAKARGAPAVLGAGPPRPTTYHQQERENQKSVARLALAGMGVNIHGEQTDYNGPGVIDADVVRQASG